METSTELNKKKDEIMNEFRKWEKSWQDYGNKDISIYEKRPLSSIDFINMLMDKYGIVFANSAV